MLHRLTMSKCVTPFFVKCAPCFSCIQHCLPLVQSTATQRELLTHASRQSCSLDTRVSCEPLSAPVSLDMIQRGEQLTLDVDVVVSLSSEPDQHTDKQAPCTCLQTDLHRAGKVVLLRRIFFCVIRSPW